MKKDNFIEKIKNHRKRMRSKILIKGEEFLLDDEILEMILFSSHKRKDTKQIARTLLKEFKNFSGVINAEIEELKKIPDIGEASIVAIKLIKIATIRMCEEDLIKKDVISSWKEAVDFFRIKIGGSKIECCEVIYLDHNNQIIKSETHQKGTINATSIYPREIIKKAIQLNTGAIILGHNHPNGSPKPSNQDIILTKELLNNLKTVGIFLHDHIIISPSGHFSFRANGILN